MRSQGLRGASRLGLLLMVERCGSAGAVLLSKWTGLDGWRWQKR